MLKNFLGGILSLLFPPRCVFCGSYLDYPKTCCGDCVKLRNQANCPICRYTYNACCCNNFFDKLLAPLSYEGKVKSAILTLKTIKNKQVVTSFAQYMEDCCGNIAVDTLVVPVPTNKKTLKERGYNQAELLAVEIAKRLSLMVDTGLLARTEDSLTQHFLTAEERRQNAEISFILASSTDLSGKHILLVDDVSATGATLNSCSKALRKAGAAGITAICVASA